jgi:hypothetical protein
MKRFGIATYVGDEYNDVIIVDRFTGRWTYELWSPHDVHHKMVDYLNTLRKNPKDEKIIAEKTALWDEGYEMYDYGVDSYHFTVYNEAMTN